MVIDLASIVETLIIAGIVGMLGLQIRLNISVMKMCNENQLRIDYLEKFVWKKEG